MFSLFKVINGHLEVNTGTNETYDLRRGLSTEFLMMFGCRCRSLLAKNWTTISSIHKLIFLNKYNCINEKAKCYGQVETLA